MEYTPWVPTDAPLAGRVETIFHLDRYAPPHPRERVVPDGRMTLVLELDGRPRHLFHPETGEIQQTVSGAWLSGVQTRHIVIGETTEPSRLAAIRFAPGGTHAFLGGPAHAWVDRVVPAVACFGPDIQDLRTSLQALPTGEAVCHGMAAWLEARVLPDRILPPVVQRVLAALAVDPGAVSLTDLVGARGGATYTRFLDAFRDTVGPSPKTYQRILRFAGAFARLQSPTPPTWAALAAELGYADQAHFTRDFRTFSGYRPTEFAATHPDRENFFPEEPPLDEA